MLIAWIAFPLVLLAVGLGWGVLVLRLAGADPRTALVVPLGLAAALVVADLLTSWSATAGLAVPAVAIGAAIGLLLARRRPRLSRWPAVAAIAVLVAYAAPVLLSGRPTFAGYVRLDDTATWLGIVDRVMSHGRSLAGLSPSTYQLNVSAYLVAGGYPTGSFMLLGIGRALTGADAAWVFQSYLACSAAALALGMYALVSPLVASARLRALISFLAAQPALLYGYSLWGGIKELTAAFLLVLVAALAAALLRGPPGPRRAMAPLAVASAALAVTLGPGAVAWVAPALAVVAVSWLCRARRAGVGVARALVSGTGLVVLTVALSVPVLVVLASFLRTDSALFSSGTGGAPAVGLGNLVRPLSVFQLAGIWPVGDFRYAPARLPTALLIWLVGVTAAAGVWLSVTRRREGPALYLALAAIGCAATALAGGTPWVVGKALAIASPALLACGLTFAAAAPTRRRVWLAAMGVIAGGVLWSNALAYHDVLLAPQGRLAELADIGGMVANAGPTLLNEYEIYGDRHFLRAGAPQEPAEYRPSLIALRDGTLLTKSGWADLDSFPLSSLLPFRSIVVRRSPAESRPPSEYRLRWQGSFYELWQRPAVPATRVLAHVALGDSGAEPWCGSAVGQPPRALCSAQAAGTPACSLVHQLGHSALAPGAELVAYQRPLATVMRATAASAPASWIRDAAAGSVRARTPGVLRARIRVPSGQRYGLWLGGSFARGFVVSVDGRRVGSVKDQLSAIGQYVHVRDLSLGAGVHEVDLRFPHADLTPGSGDTTMTVLDAISLVPLQYPATAMLTVAPGQADRLCGRPLDWIEVVAPQRAA